MAGCQCEGIEELFSEGYVSKELARYQADGPARTTRILTEAIKGAGIAGSTLLDIGGGLGAVQHELLDAGVQTATSVDASAAYLRAARLEARRRALEDRVSYYHGSFTALASQIPTADIVTLDRVICCFNDMQSLVGLSAAKARRLYGLVYPLDTWWVRLEIAIENLYFRLQRNPFRSFMHPSKKVEAILTGSGLKRIFYQRTPFWQAAVYAREFPPAE